MENREIVIIPSGVWDTRAPFYYYTNFHKQENKTFWSLIVGLDYLQNDWGKKDKLSDVTILLENRKISGKLKMAWTSYKRSLLPNNENTCSTPTIEQAIDSLRVVKNSICAQSIINYTENFETFLQCWALNFILAKLESNNPISDAEKKLIINFCPLNGFKLPNTYNICNGIPEALRILKNQPHVFINPKDNTEVSVPITDNLNAYKVINFWKDVRNLIVHKGGIVNNQFISKYSLFWKDFNIVFPHLKILNQSQINLDENSFRAVSTVFYLATKSLKEYLVEFSNGRRGHVLAPNPPTANGKVPKDLLPINAPKMLIEGDHELSYKWVSDKNFQNKITYKLKRT